MMLATNATMSYKNNLKGWLCRVTNLLFCFRDKRSNRDKHIMDNFIEVCFSLIYFPIVKAFIFLKPDSKLNKTTRFTTICVTSCSPNDFTCIRNGNAKTLKVWDRFYYVNITTGERNFSSRLLEYLNPRREKQRKYFCPQTGFPLR